MVNSYPKELSYRPESRFSYGEVYSMKQALREHGYPRRRVSWTAIFLGLALFAAVAAFFVPAFI